MYDKYGFNSEGFNKDGYNIYGFNKDGYNIDGFDTDGYDRDGLNKDGLNKFGYGKKIGKGLNISALPILLSKIYTNNSSKELIKNIKQLVNTLYKNKQITKQVYNALNKALIKMTRKDQNKIVDDKIEANNAQYDLDSMNAEISAYSNGNLSKYEYLTNKDLGYKPDAFEQPKFEFSPLGKVFTDGLDKSDRNEGLSKRLKSIENRNNNQLLAIKNIPRPAIKGQNNGGFRNNDEYKTIQDFKQGLIDKNILRKGGVKKFDKIVDKWKQTKDKKIVYKNVDTKVDTKSLTYITFLKTI